MRIYRRVWQWNPKNCIKYEGRLIIILTKFMNPLGEGLSWLKYAHFVLAQKCLFVCWLYKSLLLLYEFLLRMVNDDNGSLWEKKLSSTL